MSWVSFRSVLEVHATFYNLDKSTRCRVITLPNTEYFFKTAFGAGYHSEDKTDAVIASREYKTLGECLEDKWLCSPEWEYFVLSPSGKYIMTRKNLQIIIVKLPRKYKVNKESRSAFERFRKYVRVERKDTDVYIEHINTHKTEITDKLYRQINSIQARLDILNTTRI